MKYNNATDRKKQKILKTKKQKTKLKIQIRE